MGSKKTTTSKGSKSATSKPTKKVKKVICAIPHHANGAAFTTQRPGVLAMMQTHLTNASEKAPITKLALLEKLCADFPERDAEKMKKTISMQVPSGFRLEKGIIVHRVQTPLGKAFFIDANEDRLPKGSRHIHEQE